MNVFGIKSNIKDFIRENGIVPIFFLFWVLAAVLLPKFSQVQNNINIVTQSSIALIGAIGITFVLITGGIDLSLGYLVGLVSHTVGILLKICGFSIVVSAFFGILIGAFFGFLNGFIIVKFRIPAFIATLASGYIILGTAQILSYRWVIHNLPGSVRAFGKIRIFGLPVFVMIAAIVVVIAIILLNKTIFGRSLYALGTNSKASLFSGIKVNRFTIMAYLTSGICAAICGILFTIRVNSSQPDMGGSNFTFEAVTASVLGGVSLFGGVGKVSGCIFGVLMLKSIENILGIVGANPYLYQALSSVVVLSAIILDNLKNKYF
jgi:ribose/xylose/arabinose/galactoside ABC-type transport system permease subunit